MEKKRRKIIENGKRRRADSGDGIHTQTTGVVQCTE